jgi:hypothetical protein
MHIPFHARHKQQSGLEWWIGKRIVGPRGTIYFGRNTPKLKPTEAELKALMKKCSEAFNV